MIRRRHAACWSFLVWLQLVPQAFAAPAAPEHRPGELLVKFTANATAADRAAILSDLGAQTLGRFQAIGVDHLRITGLDVTQAIDRYQGHPKVAYIEPNVIYRAVAVPNDPQFPSLWGMQNLGQTGGLAGADIRATQAWNVFTGSSDVRIGVIDTGVDYNHVDLAANILINAGEIPGNFVDDDNNGFIDDVRGWDFVSNDNDPMDDNGHGSHCAGTSAAVGNNGIGVAGVNWTAKIVPIKFLDAFGSGSLTAAIQAIDYAIVRGVRVINASWGSYGSSSALSDAILRADSAGIVFVAAAGNDNTNIDFTPFYPAGYPAPNIVSVAATNHLDQRAFFSNYGVVAVDLGAPGENILSTFPGNNYGSISGTSMAAPHVTGVIGLIQGRFPGIGVAAAKSLLLSTVDPLGSLSGQVATGGRLNAFMPIAEPDTLAPGGIADLAVSDVDGNRVSLAWTAPGDDGATGTASRYEVRHATSPITEANFAAATAAPSPPDPLPAGAAEAMTVQGLAFGTTYYFAVKAFDEFDNPGPVSNVVNATTLPPPDIGVSPDSLSADLLTGETTQRVLTVTNTGSSSLAFTVSVEAPPGASASVEVFTTRAGVVEPVLATGTPVPLGTLAAIAPSLQRSLDLGRAVDRPEGLTWGASAPGRHLVASNVEVFGSDANAFFAGPRTRGNAFRCTSSRNLHEHRFYLSPSTSTQLWFLVYEGTSQTGLYDLISASNATPSGTGLGWYSSGPVDVPLVEGRHYLVVASFEQPSNYYNQQNVSPYPIPASFGELTMGVGWDWAPDATFPPPPSVDVPSFAFGMPVAYYQTLVTGQGLDWLSIEPDTAEVGIGGSIDLAVTFDAAGLNGGDYDALITVASNDPDEAVRQVPAHLHVTGAPDIAVAPPSMDFGTPYVGATVTDTLRVENAGTDVLVVSSVSVTPGPFSVDGSGFSLAPGEVRALAVGFMPVIAGSASGSITVQSNDSDEPTVVVPLSGEALPPPDIAVSPESLSVALLTGQTAHRNVRVENTGVTDLTFRLEIETALAQVVQHQALALAKGQADPRPGIPGLDGRGGPDQFGYRWIDSDEPGGPSFNWVEISGIGTPVPISGDDMTSNVLPIGFAFPFYGQSFSSFRMCTNGFISFTHPYPPYFNQPLPSFGAPENLLAAFWDDLYMSGANAYYHNDGGRLIVEFANVFHLSGGGPYTFQILLYPNGRIVYQYLTMGSPLNGSTIGIQDGTQTDGLTVAFNSDYVHDGMAIRFDAGPTWLAVQPDQGTVPPGGYVDLDAAFDAAGLYGGDYHASIVIESNDPNEGRVEVPAHLHVTGVADIGLSTGSMDFGDVFVSYARTESLVVTNIGTDQLVVTDVQTSPGAYSASPTAFALAPQASQGVMVTFQPGSPTSFPGTLTVHSNDPDAPQVMVALSGAGLIPPDVGVAPNSVSASLLTNQTTQRTVTVTNTGGSDLAFHLEGLRQTPPPGATARTSWQSLGPVAQPTNQVTLPEGAEAIRATYGDSSSSRILLYADSFIDGPGFHPVDLALQSLGLPYSAYYYDPYGFEVALQSKDWDLVIVDHASYYGTWWNTLHSYIAGGGRALISTFDVDGSSSVPTGLWSSLGITPAGDLQGPPPPVHWWTPAHPLFNSPETVPEFTSMFDFYTEDGDRVEAVTGDHAGFVPTRTANQDAIVVSQDRSVVVNSFIVAQNRADLDFDGKLDAVELLENEITLLSGPAWLTADVLSGVVPPGGSFPLTLTLDATGLYGGDYESDVQIVSNDPDEERVSVTAYLHVTGVPDLAVQPGSLDFGDVFVGYARTETLTVTNIGTDVLSVTGIGTAPGAYAALPGAFTLPPLASQVVAVTFQPGTQASFPGTLTVQSNDPDTPARVVPLSGAGLIPPDIAVSPPSLSVSLLSNQTADRTLLVTNGGGSDLTFTASAAFGAGAVVSHSPAFGPGAVVPKGAEPAPTGPGSRPDQGSIYATSSGVARVALPPYQGPSLEELRDHLDANVSQVLGAIPNAYPFFDGDSGYYIDDGGNDMYDGGNLLNTNLNFGGPIYYTNGVVQDEARFGTGGRYFTRKYAPGLFVMVAEVEGLGWFDITGNLGADGYGQSDGSVLSLQHQGTDYRGFVKRVYNAGDPSVNHLMIVADPAASHEFDTYTNSDYHRLFGLSPGRQLVMYLLYAGSNGGYIADPAALEIMDQFLQAIGLAPPWLGVVPESGTIPAGGSAAVTVRFDATGLFGGDYAGQVRIASNDPDDGTVIVPANLHVTGVPDILASESALDFGSLYIGNAASLSFLLVNRGTDLLQVTALTPSRSEYQAVPGGAVTLAPGETTGVTVTFTPTSPGAAPGTLVIASNDPDQPSLGIALGGIGVVPPELTYSPGSFDERLDPGSSVTRTLTIGNTGGSDLTFSLQVFDNAGNHAPAPAPASSGNDGVPGNGRLDDSPAPRVDGAGQVPPQGGALLLEIAQRLAAMTPAQLVFHDDMENGVNGWTRQLLGPDDLWHQTTRAYGTPIHSWWCGLESEGHYATGNTIRTAAVSPSIDLRHRHAPVDLMFAEYFNTESGWDYCMVDVSTDGGVNWMQLRGGRGTGAPSGYSNGWRTTQLDLSPYAGNQIKLRFFFDTGDPVGNNYPGWFFDDVVVSASGPQWLVVSPTDSVIPAGGSIDVQVTFDAAELEVGDYSGRIRLITNDLDEPETDLPVALHVLGRPNLELVPVALDFGDVFVGYSGSLSLRVRSIGQEPVENLVLAASPSAFTVSPATLPTLAPGESTDVEITFHPTTAGIQDGQLTVTSNAPTSPHVAELSGNGVPPPILQLAPTAIEESVALGGQTHTTLRVCNTGGSPLTFVARPRPAAGGGQAQASAAGGAAPALPGNEEATLSRGASPRGAASGGPDLFGYTWRDSDALGGPAFDWIDLSASGTVVPFDSFQDEGVVTSLPIGFPFPFYGDTFTTFNVCINGYLSFTNDVSEGFNQALPRADAPGHLVAPLWDNLMHIGYALSEVRYSSDGERLVVQFTNMVKAGFGSPPHQTFEVVLRPSGDILFQYQQVGPAATSSTIGIQDGVGSDGLNIVHNAPYVHGGLAIEIVRPLSWVEITPNQVTLPAGECVDLDVRLDGSSFLAGDHEAIIGLQSNDPARPLAEVPVMLHVRPAVTLEFRLDPQKIQLGTPHMDKELRVTLEPTPPLRPEDIDLSSVRVAGSIPPNPAFPQIVGDRDEDGRPDLRFGILRDDLALVLPEGDAVPVEVQGTIAWHPFMGHATIKVKLGHIRQPRANELLLVGQNYRVLYDVSDSEAPTVELLMSPDRGATWITQGSGRPNTGTIEWVVPPVTTDSALIAVVEVEAQGSAPGEVIGVLAVSDPVRIQPGSAAVSEIPLETGLLSAHPNPSDADVRLRFSLSAPADATLDVLDVQGRRVRRLSARTLESGWHTATWNGRGDDGTLRGPGVYFVRLSVGGRHWIQRIARVR